MRSVAAGLPVFRARLREFEPGIQEIIQSPQLLLLALVAAGCGHWVGAQVDTAHRMMTTSHASWAAR